MYFLDNLLVSKFEITGNLGASLGGLEEMLRVCSVVPEGGRGFCVNYGNGRVH